MIFSFRVSFIVTLTIILRTFWCRSHNSICSQQLKSHFLPIISTLKITGKRETKICRWFASIWRLRSNIHLPTDFITTTRLLRVEYLERGCKRIWNKFWHQPIHVSRMQITLILVHFSEPCVAKITRSTWIILKINMEQLHWSCMTEVLH